MDLSLSYRALASGQVDFIAGNSTDGLIRKLDLFVLKDDKHYFPPYEAAPVVREETMQTFPGLESAINELAGKISEEQMRQMNYEVDGEHRDVRDVAAAFLKSQITKTKQNPRTKEKSQTEVSPITGSPCFGFWILDFGFV